MKIVIDVEMTGLEPYGTYSQKDEILQLSIINEEGDVLFNEYFKPQNKTEWKETEEIHGISPDFVKNKKPFSDYINEIQSIIDKADTIIGYSMELDEAFLFAAGISLENKKIIDVSEAYAELYGDWNNIHQSYKRKKLAEVARTYNFDFDNLNMKCHNSLADCILTLYCYKNTYPEVTDMWHEKYSEKVEKIISCFEFDINKEIIEHLIEVATNKYCESLYDFEIAIGYEEWMEEFSIDDELDYDAISNLLKRIYYECEELREICMKQERWE